MSDKDKMWDVNAGWRIVIAHSYSAGKKQNTRINSLAVGQSKKMQNAR